MPRRLGKSTPAAGPNSGPEAVLAEFFPYIAKLPAMG
jgi:hypothetical protein